MMDLSGRWLLLPLLALVAAVHLPFTGGGPLTDDFVHLGRLPGQTVASVVTAPDPFGFYRPLPRVTFLLDDAVHGLSPVGFRITNLLLHLGVIAAAFVLARRLLGRTTSALLATLAFALTPKAHPIAVLWISARPELLMALFSLLALIAWIAWVRRGGAWRLGAAWACYAAALLSKETAALLPLLLLVTPFDTNPVARRAWAALPMIALAAALFALRARLGALMPASLDAHYNLATPIARWLRNAQNYAGRVLPSPLTLTVVAGLPGVAAWRRRRATSWPRAALLRTAAYAGVWFVVFLLPVVPIVSRSELYLYLPGFGLCLLAGLVVEALWAQAGRRAALGLALCVYVVAAGGYQASRAAAIHEDLVFSAKLVDALAASAVVQSHRGALLIVPEDGETEAFLKDTVGGYVDIVLKSAAGREDIGGAVAYTGEPRPTSARVLRCVYRGGGVTLGGTNR